MHRLSSTVFRWLPWLGCLAVVWMLWMATEAVRAEVALPQQTDASAEGSPGQSAHGPAISITEPMRVIRDAGPLFYAIILCSFLLVAFTLERAVSLRRGLVIPKPFVRLFLQQLREGALDREQALKLCIENASPVAEVFAGAIRKWGRPGVEVEQSVIDAGQRATNNLRRYLRVFYAVATVGPLLGLMGTVLGMIDTFNQISVADAQGRPELLAGGIAKALLNTAGGLAVAIPASILYVFFVSKVDRLVIEMDSLAQEVVNIVAAEEVQPPKPRAPKSRRPERQETAA